MNPERTFRKHALVAGVCYVLTFAAIPSFALYAGVRDPNYILGPGPDAPVLWGAVLEVIVALTGIGTAVALFPVVKKQNESLALGFVGTRVLEASAIFGGIAALLSVVTLRQAGTGAEGLILARALLAMYDRFFLVGRSLMPVMNAFLLGTLLFRSRLVPRILPALGLVGAPLLLAGIGTTMFGLVPPASPLNGLFVLPVALWEFSLGLWLTIKGFDPSAPVLSRQ